MPAAPGVGAASTGKSDCTPSGPQLDFDHGFTVNMCFEHEEGGERLQQNALDFGLGEKQAGLLYFFQPENAEVLIKVLDGCNNNGHYWVFVAPTTTLAFNLRVEQTATGRFWEHSNPRGGQDAKTASDLTAFPCASAAAAGVAGDAAGDIARDIARDVGVSGIAAPVIDGAGATDCSPGPVTTLSGGLVVNMCVEHLSGGASVVGQVKDYGLDSRRSALLYFFDRSNPEVLVKVLDGCALNGHYWVFVAPVTTLAFNLAIHRPAVGDSWTHGNRLNRTAAARSDLQAFPCVEGIGDNSLEGQLLGYRGDHQDVEVLLTARGVLRVARPNAAGWFSFEGLADGEYAVKAQARGHRATPARLIRLPHDDRLDPIDLTPIPSNPFVYHWEEDQSTAGTDYSANVIEPLEVEFEGETGTLADNSASTILAHEYGMLLVDTDEAAWTQEHAWRLLRTFRAIPQPSGDKPPSKWRLTRSFLRHDIQVLGSPDAPSVLVSEAAFVNANPRVATVEGKRGVWFSKRLHHAAVRYVTNGGRDVRAYETIFEDRYGVTTEIDDYAGLTGPTGNEGPGRFQKFHPEEILTLLNMLEEFPSGMHKTQGLLHIIRRLDGTDHPLYPTAPAVAWPSAGYIEFMEIAFTQSSISAIQRLAVHEKAHFLWAHVFDEQTRADWTRLGGWYRDSSSPSGWSTTKQTEFVSAYAHQKNPNEDMAETIAHFIVEPDKLRSRSLAKYEFVRDRIMQGNLYLSRIREDLTFQVYNLFPDYVFPGKIKRVDIEVAGLPDEDKEVRVEIELHALDRVLEGATSVYTRITSSVGTFRDLYLFPLDGNGRVTRDQPGTVLSGSFTLSKHAKAGYWVPIQMQISDAAGNERFQRGGDFGWKLYVDNPLEDWVPPAYVPHTARLRKGQTVAEGRNVQTIQASWQVSEGVGMRAESPCYAALNDELEGTYSFEAYGPFLTGDDLCLVEYLMPEYMPSSRYFLNQIIMIDRAGNRATVKFTDDPRDEPPPSVRLRTANPDTRPPELDLNRIRVTAEPTNPEAPNGETIVKVEFYTRDNVSGFRQGLLAFRDPQGITHDSWFYGDERGRLFPSGDPRVWKFVSHTHVLPAGSAPGTWGIASITLYDRAGNFTFEDFTETIRFEVD